MPPKRKASDMEGSDGISVDTRPTLRRSARNVVKPQEKINVGSVKWEADMAAEVWKTVKEEAKTKVKSKSASKPTTKATTTKSPKATAKENKKELHDNNKDEKTDRNYWLLKSEPLTRLHNGVDVSFPISALRALHPGSAPWDGVRNYFARNNIRSMRPGDLAFFYHSNCPSPGIVGIMEIVSMPRGDETAREVGSAYYDPNDVPGKASKTSKKGKTGAGKNGDDEAEEVEESKWSLVDVKFVREFSEKGKIGLQEIKNWGRRGGGWSKWRWLGWRGLVLVRLRGRSGSISWGLLRRGRGMGRRRGSELGP